MLKPKLGKEQHPKLHRAKQRGEKCRRSQPEFNRCCTVGLLGEAAKDHWTRAVDLAVNK